MSKKEIQVSTSQRWVQMLVALMAWCGIYIAYLGYSSDTVTMMEMFGLNYEQVGALASYPALINGVLSILLGFIIVRWGNKKVIVVGMFLGVVSEVIWAFAPNYEILMLGRLVSGVALPFIIVTTLSFSMEWFTGSDQMPLAMGVFNSGEGLGSLLGLSVFAIILVKFGFRTGSLIGAGIMLAVMIVCMTVMKNSPFSEKAEGEEDTPFTLKDFWEQVKESIRHRNALMGTLINTGLFAAYSISVYWIPTILIEDAGYSQSFAGLMGTLYPIAGLVGGLITGYISAKTSKRKVFIWLGSLLSSICTVMMIFAIKAESWSMLCVLLLAAGFFVYAAYALMLTLVGETVRTEILGTANGILAGVGSIFGGTIFPYMLGAIKEATDSYVIGFVALSVACFALLFVPGLLCKEKDSYAE